MSKTRQKLEGILERLGQRTDITSSAIVTIDGLMMASVLQNKINSDAVSAMSAAMIALGTRVGKALNQGSIEQVIVKSEKGYTIAVECGSTAALVALTNKDAQLGLIFFELKKSVLEALSML